MSDIRISVMIDLPFGSTITVDGTFDERVKDEILAAFAAFHSRERNAQALAVFAQRNRREESND